MATSNVEELITYLWERLDNIEAIRTVLEDTLDLIEQDIKEFEEMTVLYAQ